jgi:hypothetical protein
MSHYNDLLIDLMGSYFIIIIGHRRAVDVFTVTSDASTIYFFSGRFVGKVLSQSDNYNDNSLSMVFEARLDICTKDPIPNLRRPNPLKSLIGTYTSLTIVGDIHGAVRSSHAGAKLIALPALEHGDFQKPIVFDLGSKWQAIVTIHSDVDIIAELDG